MTNAPATAPKPASPANPATTAASLLQLGLRAAEAFGRPDLVARLNHASRALDHPEINIVVAGEFKQGKSSLVNALLGAPICPVDDDVATAVPTFVKFGPQVKATALVETNALPSDSDQLERERHEIPVGDVRRYVVEGGDASRSVTAVEIELPRKMLAGGLVIIDTPGVGGLGSGHAAASLGAISLADALIFVSDASQEYTRTEIDFLKRAVELCPTVIGAMTKIDFYPDWRQILALDESHLERTGLEMKVLAVSSPLRNRAVKSNDSELNGESGFIELVRFVNDQVGRHGTAQLAISASQEVAAVCAQLESQFEGERAALADPERAQAVIDQLTATRQRAEALKGAAARWSQTLNDGIADLTSDVDHDFRGRIRRIIQEADESIEATDPADTWPQTEAWLDSRASYEMIANYTYLRDRAAELSERVAEHFREASGQVLGELAVYNPAPVLGSASVEHNISLDKMGVAKQALVAMRSMYGGLLMFTMLGSLVGIALGPIGVGIGLVMGRKGLRDEKERQLTLRRNQAKNAIRRYSDEVSFIMGKDSRDTLRRIQRQLRDYYSARAEELQRSTTEALLKASESAKQTQAEREKRLRDIDAELTRLRQLHERAATLARQLTTGTSA
jgi:hypothetical protein